MGPKVKTGRRPPPTQAFGPGQAADDTATRSPAPVLVVIDMMQNVVEISDDIANDDSSPFNCALGRFVLRRPLAAGFVGPVVNEGCIAGDDALSEAMRVNVDESARRGYAPMPAKVFPYSRVPAVAHFGSEHIAH